MNDLLNKLGEALLMALGMFWQVSWSLVLGFTIAAILQTVVSADQMRRAFGRGDAREIALATLAGAASSSCSYASAAIMRTMFKKGAALVTSLAFLFASTNLVLELGLILLILMGWQFMAAEWLGGVVLIVIMSVLVKLTYPGRLVDEARAFEERSSGHQHHSMTVEGGGSAWQRLAKPEARIAIAQNFAMEWSMLWKDLAIGFLFGGFVAAFVPDAVWKTVFLSGASPWLQVPVDALIGPLIAIVTFVCSIGNVPLAAVLWASGAGFGGVLAFLYADLIVVPLLDIYRRYFGWRMTAYIGGILYVTMVAAAIIMDLLFTALGWVPAHDTDVKARITHFSIDYTFWLNLAFGALAAWLFWINHKHPMDHGSHGHAEADHNGVCPAHNTP